MQTTNKNIKKTVATTATGKPAEKIDVNPTDKSIREEVVLTFGRFNPPTIGHQRLVEYMESLAEASGADVKVFLSHRTDDKKNLLEYDAKFKLCKEAFGDCVVESEFKTIIEILESLSGRYKRATVVVGSDREEAFAERLPLYNGDLYEFQEINVIGFSRQENISSTKMRQFVAEGDGEAFYSNLPDNLKEHYFEIMEGLLGLTADLKSSDVRMVKALSPLGKWVWRKVKRDNNVLKNKVGSFKILKPLTPSLPARVTAEETMPTKVGKFTKKQKQWLRLQDEETVTELSQRSVISYIDKAANERGKAEHFGDLKKLKKRERGLDSAVNRMHKWYGKSKGS